MESWYVLASKLNYLNPKEMFEDLYIHKGLSLQSLAFRFKVSPQAIRYQLSKYSIHLKARGGTHKGEKE